jgi:hypothetical protein
MSPVAEPDPYVVLGVPRTASDAEIRAAYRALVARYHPDRHQGNPLEDLAAARMVEINRAYDILSDKQRRAAYDEGSAGWQGPRAEPPIRRNSRAVKIIAVLLALPLLLRFGRFLVGALVALVRLGAESTVWLRGTPVAAGLVLLAVVLLVVALFRRRRTKARPKSGPSRSST